MELNNLQAYFGNISHVGQFYRDFELDCDKCPAKEYCRYDTQHDECLFAFEGWAMTICKGNELTNLHEYCSSEEHIREFVMPYLGQSSCFNCPKRYDCGLKENYIPMCDDEFIKWCMANKDYRIGEMSDGRQ